MHHPDRAVHVQVISAGIAVRPDGSERARPPVSRPRRKVGFEYFRRSRGPATEGDVMLVHARPGPRHRPTALNHDIRRIEIIVSDVDRAGRLWRRSRGREILRRQSSGRGSNDLRRGCTDAVERARHTARVRGAFRHAQPRPVQGYWNGKSCRRISPPAFTLVCTLTYVVSARICERMAAVMATVLSIRSPLKARPVEGLGET